MNKENLLTGDVDETDDETIGGLSDSDVDDIEDQLLKAHLKDESEEYRWILELILKETVPNGVS